MVLGNSKGLVSGGLLSWCDLDTQHSGAVVVAVCKKSLSLIICIQFYTSTKKNSAWLCNLVHHNHQNKLYPLTSK